MDKLLNIENIYQKWVEDFKPSVKMWFYDFLSRKESKTYQTLKENTSKNSQLLPISVSFSVSSLCFLIERNLGRKKNINSLMHNLPIDKEVTKKQLIKWVTT